MGRASISYANKDYESLREELLARIPQLTERWTDFNESDLGVVLLELFCAVGDMLAYYLDAQAAEAFLPTARQRQNVINLCKLINCRLDEPVAATTVLRFSVSSPLDYDLTIPAGTVCRATLDDGTLDFETVAEAVIARGSSFIDVAARQGTRKSEEFTGTGESCQSFPLVSSNVAQGSVKVKIADQEWQEVPHFADSGLTDEHFTIETDGLDVTKVVFGSGYSGTVPPPGETIYVEYLETAGNAGNLGRDLITDLVTPIYHAGVMVSLGVTNTVPATNGSDRESIEHARLHAPAEFGTLWKAVTKDDYKALAEGFPGVAKARVLDSNDSGDIRYYQVHMVVAPVGGGMPTALLKEQLLAFIESRKVVTIEVNLFDPAYVPVAVDAEVFVYPGEDPDEVRRRIESALADAFAFERMSFGQWVYLSDLVSLIDGIRGVSHVKLICPASDIEIALGQIATLGETHINVRVVE